MRRRLLIVRPAATGVDHGGDEVLYRRTMSALAQAFDLTVFDIPRVDRTTQLIETLKGAPGEVAAYISKARERDLGHTLASETFDAACFFNEATASYQAAAWAADTPCVLISHNTHSMVARSDPSLLGRLITPLAAQFERRYFNDPKSVLVCISEVDRSALRAVGIYRTDIIMSPPGAPPPTPLSHDARLSPEAVLTGSYAWWRKRRDVKAFAQEPSPPFTVWLADPIAEAALVDSGLDLRVGAPDWGDVRFGLITDRFVGGFKLKSTEYVARNCIILSFADIRVEFDGLPHAEEFVRYVRSRAEVAGILQSYAGAAGVVDRFRVFKDACMSRFDWTRCLEPLNGAIDLAIERRPRRVAT